MGIWNTKGIDTNWRMWKTFQSCFHFFFCIELPSNIVKYHQIHLIVIPQKYRSKLISDPILFDKSNRNEPVHQQTKEIFLRSKEFRKKQFSCWMNGIAPICEGDGISHQMRKRWRGWIKLFCPLNPWRWQTFLWKCNSKLRFRILFPFQNPKNFEMVSLTLTYISHDFYFTETFTFTFKRLIIWEMFIFYISLLLLVLVLVFKVQILKRWVLLKFHFYF